MSDDYGNLSQDVLTARAATGRLVALLPVGAFENHGPHLPLGTDHIIADELSVRLAAAAGEAVIRLPGIWLGVSGEHVSGAASSQATLSIEADTLISQIDAVAAGLARAGIKRLLLLNGHGGNISALNIAVLNARRQHGILAANAHWLDVGLPPELAPPTEARADVHGGWLETSLMLAIRPELVRRESATANPAVGEGSLLFPSGPVQWGWKTDDLAQGGWVGRPDLATAEIGSKLLSHALTQFQLLIAEMAARSLSETG
ncbi:MAG: creatininase family protein [Rhodospirillales bacterium]